MGATTDKPYKCFPINSLYLNNEKKQYFEAYENIKKIIYLIRKNKQLNNEVYLISTKSIPNFIKLIEESKVLDYITNENIDNLNISENSLKSLFLNYNIERNIKIFHEYEECRSLTEPSKEEKNEFIIVDDSFINNMDMGINNENIKIMKVILYINKDSSIMKIQFPICKKNISIQEIKTGYFKFIEKEDTNNKDIKKKINPKRIIIIHKNKNIKNIINSNMLKEKLKNNSIFRENIINMRKLNKNGKVIIKNKSYLNRKNISNYIKYHNNSNKLNNSISCYNNNYCNDNCNNNNYNNNNYNNNYNNSYNNNNYNNNYNNSNNNNYYYYNNNNNYNNYNNSNNNYNNSYNNNHNIINFNKSNLYSNNNVNDYNFNFRLNSNYYNNSFNNNIYNSDYIYRNNSISMQYNSYSYQNNPNNMLINNQIQQNEINITNNNYSPIIYQNNSVNLNNKYMNNGYNHDNFNNYNVFNQYKSSNNNVINNNNNFNNNDNYKSEKRSFLTNNQLNLKKYFIDTSHISNMTNNYLNKNSKSNNNKQINDFKNPLLIGLINIGSTCYMNAPLQCLSNIESLTNYFLLKKEKFLKIPKYSNVKKISKAYSDVIYHLWDENNKTKEFNPTYFKEIISKEDKKFEGTKANDSKDLILLLYQKMHEELNTKNIYKNNEKNINDLDPEIQYLKCKNRFESRNKSIISDLFYFIQVNIKRCLICGTLTYTFSIYNILIFPLEKARIFKEKKQQNFENVNLSDCFEYHISEKNPLLDKYIYCNKCKQNTNYVVSSRISSLPEILTIILNRGDNLQFDVEFQINHNIDDLDKYMIKLNGNKDQLNYRYVLIGIVIHIGNSGEDGHFFTYCKSPVDKKWYSYNDSKVEEISDPLESNKGIPYLLFFQKIKNENFLYN